MIVIVAAMTVIGGVCAIIACWSLVAGNLPLAFGLVTAGMILDMLDGPLARRLGVESKLGAWLDSFADAFVYLLFPALFWYLHIGISLPVLALFVGAGCFRLVRFAIKGLEEQQGRRVYSGMPVYYDQALLALSLAFAPDYRVLSFVLMVVSALAVSNVPFAKLRVRTLSSALVLYVAIVFFKVLYVS